jgi:hypothetical protein
MFLFVMDGTRRSRCKMRPPVARLERLVTRLFGPSLLPVGRKRAMFNQHRLAPRRIGVDRIGADGCAPFRDP